MSHLERRGEIHRRKLAFDRLGNLLAAVAGVHAPKAGRAIEHLVAIDVGVIHAIGRGQQPGGRLELPVCRERHPEIVENRGVGVGDLVHRRLHYATTEISDFPAPNKSFSMLI
ncbi:hypothetical protein RHSP_42852 [Rhizobium freirei PRF 81]|uniref:Uncharacterized protein n=1 Tax=Rhizobium freirei PRF 81 TaxID=363754 RepID=N6VCE9_9HYPH|nr:hypothetical protein RHSP_42852 [Rhizobium freirei PRF 81]